MTSFSLEIIDEKNMTSSEDRKIRELLCQCFPDDLSFFSVCRHWNNCLSEYSLVYRNADQILGHVAIVTRTIRWGDQSMRMAGIQSLAVDVSMRKSGVSQELMTQCMDESKRRGYELGLLFCLPKLEAFYSRLGWSKIISPIMVRNEQGQTILLPDKNIGMYQTLTPITIPIGTLDILGREW
jgi:predicted N-acetyltransferase YhbS